MRLWDSPHRLRLLAKNLSPPSREMGNLLCFICAMKWTCSPFQAAHMAALVKKPRSSLEWGLCFALLLGIYSLCYFDATLDINQTDLYCRYAYPWWKEKEIDSEAKRLQGLCPLTPEEITLVLKALGFTKDTLIYIASGEIYGGERRLAALKAAYPKLVSTSLLVIVLKIFYLDANLLSFILY